MVVAASSMWVVYGDRYNSMNVALTKLTRFASRLTVALATASLLGTFSCNSSTQPVPDGALRVLFIGKSLTYTNDLPLLLSAIADSTGVRPIHTGSVTFGGLSLEDHWYRGDALEAIDSRRWDVVVMQQGPSSTDANRAHLILWADRFAARIRAAGGQPALYQVWPEAVRKDVFPRVLDSYRLAAESVNGELLPVGAAWLAAWDRDANLPLYGPDGFYPSPTATYLAAITMYAALLDESAVGLPCRVGVRGSATPVVDLSPADAAALQAAADEVIAARSP